MQLPPQSRTTTTTGRPACEWKARKQEDGQGEGEWGWGAAGPVGEGSRSLAAGRAGREGAPAFEVGVRSVQRRGSTRRGGVDPRCFERRSARVPAGCRQAGPARGAERAAERCHVVTRVGRFVVDGRSGSVDLVALLGGSLGSSFNIADWRRGRALVEQRPRPGRAPNVALARSLPRVAGLLGRLRLSHHKRVQKENPDERVLRVVPWGQVRDIPTRKTASKAMFKSRCSCRSSQVQDRRGVVRLFSRFRRAVPLRIGSSPKRLIFQCAAPPLSAL